MMVLLYCFLSQRPAMINREFSKVGIFWSMSALLSVLVLLACSSQNVDCFLFLFIFLEYFVCSFVRVWCLCAAIVVRTDDTSNQGMFCLHARHPLCGYSFLRRE